MSYLSVLSKIRTPEFNAFTNTDMYLRVERLARTGEYALAIDNLTALTMFRQSMKEYIDELTDSTSPISKDAEKESVINLFDDLKRYVEIYSMVAKGKDKYNLNNSNYSLTDMLCFESFQMYEMFDKAFAIWGNNDNVTPLYDLSAYKKTIVVELFMPLASFIGFPGSFQRYEGWKEHSQAVSTFLLQHEALTSLVIFNDIQTLFAESVEDVGDNSELTEEERLSFANKAAVDIDREISYLDNFLKGKDLEDFGKSPLFELALIYRALGKIRYVKQYADVK